MIDAKDKRKTMKGVTDPIAFEEQEAHMQQEQQTLFHVEETGKKSS